MMQRRCGTDTVHGLVNGQTDWPDQHKESPTGQCRIKDILTKAAKKALGKNDSEEAAKGDLPIWNSGRK